VALVGGYTDPRNIPAFVLGLDLGQSVDYSALAVLEEPCWIGGEEMASRYFVRDGAYGWVAPDRLAPSMLEAARWANAREDRAFGGRPPRPPLPLVRLHRWDLGTSYPRIVRDVGALLAAPLLGAALALFQAKRLPLVPGPLTDTLVQELREMRLKINIASGRDSYEPHREGQHDDLTLAVALACWYREYQLEHVEADLVERWSAPPAGETAPTRDRRSSVR
jgi:hypothetical protein